MSGGVAYIYDPENTFSARFNPEMASLESVIAGSEDEAELLGLLQNHQRHTGSPVAERILGDWDTSRGLFRKVMPEAFAQIQRERAEQAATAGD
jgi:glutamate synthase (NADPH/NADH) large chain